jgi:Tetratricopeptide repeat
MKRIVSFLLMMVLSVAAFAVPTEAAVQAEVQRGNYAQAESMMREVVQAKPNSAKAHYIYAEMLAHNARFDQAAAEVGLAKQIDPDIRFTPADKFRAFEQLIDKEQRAAAANKVRAEPSSSFTPSTQPMAAAEQRSSGLPGWVWGVGFALIAVMLWRIVSSTRRPPTNAAPGYSGTGMPMGGAMPMNNGMPMGGGVPMGGTTGGNGMLGTGIAAAGGFAAGMLAEKLFDGHRDTGFSNNGGNALGSGNNNGLVPGMFDDSPQYNPAAQELEQRPIDFGTGNDWGGDTSSSDSSDNSSSDDGW